MEVGVVQVLICLYACFTFARANENQVGDWIKSCEDVHTLAETMDSNYNPTRHERDWIMKCLMPTWPPFDPSDYEEQGYIPESTTEWFELSTEPASEEYVEVFQPTHEVVLPVQESESRIKESYKQHSVHKLPVQESESRIKESYKQHSVHKLPVQESESRIKESYKQHSVHKLPVQEPESRIQESYEEHSIHKLPVQESLYEEHPVYVGSSRGIPGFNYPNYFDIPLTSFTCMEKDIIPGFYADLETGCQVFHVCWPHRRESFLCPVGTIFNQALLACDFWYNSNCSMAPLYYNVNAHVYHKALQEPGNVVGSMIDTLIEKGKHDEPDQPVQTQPEEAKGAVKAEPDMSYVMKFLPIKAKVTVYPETNVQKSKIVAEASVGQKKMVKKPVVTIEKPQVQIYQHMSSSKPVHTPSVSEIVQEIFNVATKIVAESRGLASRLKTEHMKLYNPIPLPTLNPRFITKPVAVENLPEEPMKNSEILSQRQPKSMKVVKKTLYKPAVGATTSKKVSPLTRKVLAGNYLKLLKMKSY